MSNLLLIYCYFSVTIATVATYDHVTQCSGSTTIGETNPYEFADNLDGETGAVFMIEDVNFQVKCCGVLSYWEINARSLASIDLQVWRRNTSTYELVGFNTVTPTTTGNFIYNVPTSETISVKHGDYIGWFSPTSEIISYDSGSSYPIMNRKKTGQSSFTVGDSLNWANENVAGSNRQYAIGAKVIAGDTPTFNIGTNYATTVDESAASGATVVTLSIVDDDSLDIHTVNLLSTQNGYFQLDSANLVIKTTQAMIPEGVYEMQLQVVDDCYLSSTSSVTLTVKNTEITMNNLPHLLTVREDVFQQIKLYDLDITEATDGWYCDMEDTNSVPFLVRQVNAASGPEYGLYLKDWPQLNFDTKSEYLLKIHCYDDEHTASNTATITIEKNSDPVFDNLDGTVVIDAETVVNGEVIFVVSVTDPEDDQIIYTMTTNPPGGPFDILDSGKVVLTSNVLRHHESAAYDLSITISDGYNTVGPRTLTVTINNINDKPEITSLPSDINLIENTALSTSLFTVTVDDLDAGDPRVFTATFDPPDAVKYFTIDSSGVVSTSAVHNVDFDILTDISIEMYIMVTDGKEHDEKVLAIQIQNLNEPPSFSQTHYSVTRNEGNSGEKFPLTRYNLRDPDKDDTHTYSIDCGSNTSRVAIDTNTGQISFSGEYDLDTSGTPTDFSCTVNVADYDGLSDYCEIAVNVRYVNEYTPSFPFDEYNLIVYYYEIIGIIKTSIVATDLDLTDHGMFYYSLKQTYDSGKELFGVLSNGSVYIKDDLSSYGTLGAMFDVILLASDTGGMVGSATVHIAIPQAASDPEATTEAPIMYTKNFINTAMLAVSVIGGVAAILLSGFLMYKYCKSPKCGAPGWNCCKRRPKPSKPPKEKPPKSPSPKPVTPPPSYTPQEEMSLPKPIQLEESRQQRVALSGVKVQHSVSDHLNRKDERIYETTSRNQESRDINRWISDVPDQERLDNSWNTKTLYF